VNRYLLEIRDLVETERSVCDQYMCRSIEVMGRTNIFCVPKAVHVKWLLHS